MTGILTNLGTALGRELIGRFFQGRDQKSLSNAINATLPQIQQAQAQNIQNFTSLLNSGGDISQFQPAAFNFPAELFQNPNVANQIIGAAFGGGFGGNQLANSLATQASQNNSFNNQRGLAGFNLTGDVSISDAIRGGQQVPVDQVLSGRSALDEAGVAGDLLVEDTRFRNQETLQDARLAVEKERLDLDRRRVALQERIAKNGGGVEGLKTSDLRQIDITADKRADNAITDEFIRNNPDAVFDPISQAPLSMSQIAVLAKQQENYEEQKASFKARFINEILGNVGGTPQQQPQQAPLQPVPSGQQSRRNLNTTANQAISAIRRGASPEEVNQILQTLGLSEQEIGQVNNLIANELQGPRQ